MLNPRIAIGGTLVFGTVTSLFGKIAYMTPGVGLGDASVSAEHTFVKPWFLVLTMFVGMSGCLPLAGCRLPKLKDGLLLGLPAAFDLTSTSLLNVGLIWVNPSIYQMMRGAEMIFAAVFGVTFLRRRLNKLHFTAILMSVTGILLVGSASILAGEVHGAGTPTEQFLGMSLIVLAQATQAAQITVEDLFMSDLGMDDAQVVGMEGLWGTAMTLIILACAQRLPGSDVGGVMENTWDSLQLLASSHRLSMVILVQMFSLFFYNYCGMSVTGNFSGVFRTVLETLRTLNVWLVDLALFYGHVGDLGEAWTHYSCIQAAGFVVLIAATLLYRRGDERELKRTEQEGYLLAK
jgi:drug/metabolite transporter (DMT)-like permease